MAEQAVSVLVRVELVRAVVLVALPALVFEPVLAAQVLQSLFWVVTV
ncbi:MAG: hypothetical protein HN837_01640, partial [Chloroflexi bacterium]|nr:hypothetical protein [Chloroflexota bacterium]